MCVDNKRFQPGNNNTNAATPAQNGGGHHHASSSRAGQRAHLHATTTADIVGTNQSYGGVVASTNQNQAQQAHSNGVVLKPSSKDLESKYLLS